MNYSHFLSVNEAVEHIGTFDQMQNPRSELVKLLSRGIVEARAKRWHNADGDLWACNADLVECDESRFNLEYVLRNLDVSPTIIDEKYPSEYFGDDVEIYRGFWNKDFDAIDHGEWHRTYPDWISADWQRGEFLSLGVRESTDAENRTTYSCSFAHGAGVMIDREQLDIFYPGIAQPASTASSDVTARARSTTYDWEAAFADVAAMLYSDLEFEDVNARGVQAQIVGALRTSFEKRRLPIPSDDTLKPKARMIVGALRALNGK